MTSPWKSASAPSSQFSTATYVGELAFVCIGGVHETFKLGDNTVPAARTNIVILTGPEAGREWTDAMLFGVITVDQCRGDVGNVILGRFRARRGGNNRDMYYIDNEITPYDNQIAQGWDAAYPGKLLQLQQQAVLLYQAEEIKLNGGQPAQQNQAAPPPPPPPPPPAAPPAAAPPWGAPAPAAAAPAAAPPPWPVAAPAGSTDTPPY